MKKFIAIVVLFVAFTASAFANEDYAVVKNGEKVTIHQITTSYSGPHTWVSTFSLVNPTIAQLSEIGLPSYCWPLVNGQDGAWDTRLIKAGQDLDEMKAKYENEVEEVSYLDDQIKLKNVYIGLLIAVSAFLFIGLMVKMQDIKKLKK